MAGLMRLGRHRPDLRRILERWQRHERLDDPHAWAYQRLERERPAPGSGNDAGLDRLGVLVDKPLGDEADRRLGDLKN